MKTSKKEKKNLKQSRIPRISTRGFYDLKNGKAILGKSYMLYPKNFFECLGDFSEFTIMIHGLRNNKSGALTKFQIAQKRLRQLGYKFPVVGFSYDSNTKGVQYKSQVVKATNVGRIIAKKNGANLARFILDSKKKNPNTKIRLIGHSLGSEVIVYTIDKLKHHKGIIESAYFFGGSVPADMINPQKFGKAIQNTIRQKLTNYFSPYDDVLKFAYQYGLIERPIGYTGADGKTVPKYTQKQVKPRNHRFASYAVTLSQYP